MTLDLLEISSLNLAYSLSRIVSFFASVVFRSKYFKLKIKYLLYIELNEKYVKRRCLTSKEQNSRKNVEIPTQKRKIPLKNAEINESKIELRMDDRNE